MYYIIFNTKRTYQDCTESVHAHKDQKHFNNKCYNKTSSIPKSEKIYKFRVKFWNLRTIKAAFLVQFLDSFFQKGGNAVEHIHCNNTRWFKWLKQNGVGFAGSIATTYNEAFKHNCK